MPSMQEGQFAYQQEGECQIAVDLSVYTTRRTSTEKLRNPTSDIKGRIYKAIAGACVEPLRGSLRQTKSVGKR